MFAIRAIKKVNTKALFSRSCSDAKQEASTRASWQGHGAVSICPVGRRNVWDPCWRCLTVSAILFYPFQQVYDQFPINLHSITSTHGAQLTPAFTLDTCFRRKGQRQIVYSVGKFISGAIVFITVQPERRTVSMTSLTKPTTSAGGNKVIRVKRATLPTKCDMQARHRSNSSK
jgi:hypothetical protein